MEDREKIVRKYFDMWLQKDISNIDEIFDNEIRYSECHGPEYKGIVQFKQWFSDWNLHGTVLQWDIKQFLHQRKVTVVEWYFKCDWENHTDGFDGISLISFNNAGKITELKEFQSKAEHSFPYGI